MPLGSFSFLSMVGDFLLKFGIDVLSIFVFSYVLYYRKHRDREGLVSYLLFNVFLFVIVYFLRHLDVSLTVGFAIFGLLGLVRLRSDSFNKVDITYFIGALTLAIINGVIQQGVVLFLANVVILLTTFLVDFHFVSRKPFRKLLYTLDSIPPTLLSDKNETIKALSRHLNIHVVDYEVVQVNSLRDSVEIFLTYKTDE